MRFKIWVIIIGGKMSRGDNNCIPIKLYRIWKAMRSRCNNKNYYAYKWYGARGIKICKNWNDYFTFREWALSSGWKEGLQIDRKDTNGDYCPENCRWANRKEQTNNKRNNINVTINGETHTLNEWSRIKNIHPATIRGRIRSGWKKENAILTPVKKNNVRKKYFTINGIRKTLYQWCIVYNKGLSNVEKWLSRGKTILEALGATNGSE